MKLFENKWISFNNSKIKTINQITKNGVLGSSINQVLPFFIVLTSSQFVNAFTKNGFSNVHFLWTPSSNKSPWFMYDPFGHMLQEFTGRKIDFRWYKNSKNAVLGFRNFEKWTAMNWNMLEYSKGMIPVLKGFITIFQLSC